jgi:spermidine synthase
MIPWELVDRAPIPRNRGELCLFRRGKEFSIRVDRYELMNSRAHASEDALAEIACARVAASPGCRLLIGGLGMGYTTASALRSLDNRQGLTSLRGAPPPRSSREQHVPDRFPLDGSQIDSIVVAELVPAVVAWNRGPLADLAGRPLDDPRVAVREVDVAEILKTSHQAYDAILLDVDNGPDGITQDVNNWLYSQAGLHAACNALRPAGVLAMWSSRTNPAFAERLRRAGLAVEEARVHAHAPRKGTQHTIWLAKR